MTRECVFCSIVAGDTNAALVVRRAGATAFMDLCPIRPGHVLVVPDFHEQDFEALEHARMCDVMSVAGEVARAVKQAFAPPKVGFAVAGFDVPHAHLHVIPLHHPDDLTSKRLLDGDLTMMSLADRERIAAQIRGLL